MIDNKRVKDNHQGGIDRVKQRKGDMERGQGGKMYNAPREQADWKRSGSKLTPRQG